MKKKLLAVFLALVMLFGITACNPSDEQEPDDAGVDDSGKVTISFFGWGDTEEQNNYQALVNKFMAENKDVIVDYSAESSSTYMTTLKSRAKNLPDIFYMPDYDFLEWVANGKLKDISSYMSEDDLNKLWPHAIDEYYFNPATMSLGKSAGAGLYGLPKDLGPFTLVYNKTLLESQMTKLNFTEDEKADVYAKLSPTNPMTWAEFRALLKKIDPNPNDNIYGISHFELEAAVYSNNASFFDEGAVHQTITDKNFTDAVQFIADLCLVDHVMPTADNQVSTNGYQRFKAQGCVFSFMGPWDCADFWKTVKFEYDILPVPYNGENPDAVSTAWVGSMGYCIKHNAGKAKTEAAIRLANYLCYNEDAQREFYKLGQQVPNIISMAENEYVNDTQSILGTKNPKSRSVWVDTIQTTGDNDKVRGKVRSRYYTYSSDWYAGLTEHFSNVGMWDGTVTAASACSTYANTFQAALNEMRANLG